MYLTDSEIRERLPELEIIGPNPDHPFEPGIQIQPCSIDLRVSDVFWIPKRRRRLLRGLMRGKQIAVDLRRSDIHALEPLRYWKQIELREGQIITIKPGQTVMGRIYERFRMPSNCAGKIEGRSSFARLGLSVHCTGDFINPGWQGHMPLQLSNAGPYPLRLGPYFSICQLMLVPLARQPDRSYGDPSLCSKYNNNDGGPSLWWRDARVKQLQQRLGQSDVAIAIQQEIVHRVRFESADIIDRLQKDIDRKRQGQIENADQLLDEFAWKEDRRRMIDRICLASPALFLGGVLASLFAPVGPWTIALPILTILALFIAYAAYERRDEGYLGNAELRRLLPPDGQA